ncbi:MAG: GNAT family N-acetyltransferase [Bacteroidales bacterium]
MYEITHNADEGIFITVIDGVTAYVEYVIEDGALCITHTIVPDEIGGRGIASALVSESYAYADAVGLKRKASCTYAAAWLKRKGYNA